MRNFLLFFFALAACCCNAQQTSNHISIIPPSPTAGSISRYGDIPLNHSTGSPNLSIPLIEVKEGSLSIPVSINYNYTGYKPDEPKGLAGLGWNMIAGGVITRSVRGLKDEGGFGYFNIGDWVHDQATDYVYGTINEVSDFFLDVNGGSKDGEPDIFNFNFLGHSGKFFMGSDGEFHIVSQKKLKFEYEASTGGIDTDHPLYDKSIKSWTVTDEMGNVYHFNKVEYSWSLFDIEALDRREKVISGWYLTEVISPNGDKITLTYSDPDHLKPRIQASFTETITLNFGSLSIHPYYTDKHGLNKNFSEEIFINRISGTNWDLDFEYDSYTEAFGSSDSYLKKISKLKYYDKVSNPGTPALIKEINLTTTGNGPLLTEVKEINGTAKANVHTFQYFGDVSAYTLMGSKGLDYWGYYNGASNDYMIPYYGAVREPDYGQTLSGMLKKVTYPTGGSSEFQYERNQYSYVNNTPYSAIRKRIEIHDFQYKNKQVIFGAEDTIRITYPTQFETIVTVDAGIIMDSVHCPESSIGYLDPGLYHAMTYRPLMDHTCLKLETGYFEDTLRTMTIRLILTRIDTTIKNDYGGLRVKKIVNTVSENQKYSRNFEYDDFADSTLSSGIVSDLGNYILNAQQTLNVVSSDSSFGSYNSGVRYTPAVCFLSEPFNAMQLSPLMYFNVREYTQAEDSTISQESKYYFTSSLDGYVDSRGQTVGGGTNLVGPAESLDFARSLTKKVELVRTGDSLAVQKDSSSYTSASDLLTNNYYFSRNLYRHYFATIKLELSSPGSTTFKDFPLYFNKIYKTFSSWHYLKSKTVTTFGKNNNDYVRNTITYHYDNPQHLQLTRTRSGKSNGQIIETRIKYPLDYDSVATPAPYIRKMINTHMVNYPVETVTVLEKDATHRYVTDADITTYREFPGNINNDTLVLPYKKFSFLNNTYLKALGSYTPYTGLSDEVGSADFREVIKYNAYDTGGNILNLLYNKRDHVSYLWSYNSQYPVAEIKNASDSEVTSALATLGTSTSALGSMTDSDNIKIKLDDLRAALPATPITSYLYKPLVGVRTVTSPNLLNTYYEYDAFNRLRFIKDNNLKTVKRIDYHYATE